MIKKCDRLQGMSDMSSILSVPPELNKAAMDLHIAPQAADQVEQADEKLKFHGSQNPLAYLEQHTWRSPAPA